MNIDLTAKWPVPVAPSWNTLDSTKLKAYMDCPRRFFYEYVLGWRPDAMNNHLVFGNAIHQALEHLYLNGFEADHLKDAYNLFETYYRQYFPPSTDDLFEPKTPSRAFMMLAEYANHYSGDFRNFDILYTEVAFTVSVMDGMTLAGKMDVIARDKQKDKIFSLEHKTSQGYYNAAWEVQWPLSIQVGTYTHALNCLYSPEITDGVRINGIFFHKTKKFDFTFKRPSMGKTPDQLQVWLDTVMSWSRMLKNDFATLQMQDESDPTLVAFPMRPTACNDYFRECTYHDYCLAWPNPLRKCWQPPLGMRIEHWNPLEEYHRHEMHLGGAEK